MYCDAECHFADSHYADSHYADSHYADSNYADSYYADSHYVKRCYAECHGATTAIGHYMFCFLSLPQLNVLKLFILFVLN
jgi:hypothetical protein